MKLIELIDALRVKLDEQGDVPVVLVSGGQVFYAASLSVDCYDRAEGMVVEIIAEGG